MQINNKVIEFENIKSANTGEVIKMNHNLTNNEILSLQDLFKQGLICAGSLYELLDLQTL